MASLKAKWWLRRTGDGIRRTSAELSRGWFEGTRSCKQMVQQRQSWSGGKQWWGYCPRPKVTVTATGTKETNYENGKTQWEDPIAIDSKMNLGIPEEMGKTL